VEKDRASRLTSANVSHSSEAQNASSENALEFCQTKHPQFAVEGANALPQEYVPAKMGMTVPSASSTFVLGISRMTAECAVFPMDRAQIQTLAYVTLGTPVLNVSCTLAMDY